MLREVGENVPFPFPLRTNSALILSVKSDGQSAGSIGGAFISVCCVVVGGHGAIYPENITVRINKCNFLS